MKEQNERTGFALAGAVIAAVTASLCCILPVIAAVLGVTGFAASEFFARWRPYLLASTFGLLTVGFYLAYRPAKGSCEPGGACERTPLGRWNRPVLWLVTVIVVALAAFPYYSGWVVRAVTKETPRASSKGAVAHLTLSVQGMDCPACAAPLENNLRQIPGVRQARVSFEDKRASIDYDPAAVDELRLTKVFTDAGYKAVALSTATH
jgi:mercuric ion transport protein